MPFRTLDSNLCDEATKSAIEGAGFVCISGDEIFAHQSILWDLSQSALTEQLLKVCYRSAVIRAFGTLQAHLKAADLLARPPFAVLSRRSQALRLIEQERQHGQHCA